MANEKDLEDEQSRKLVRLGAARSGMSVSGLSVTFTFPAGD